VAGVHDDDLLAERSSRYLGSFSVGFRARVARVCEKADDRGGTVKHFSALCDQRVGKQAYTGPVHADDKATLDRINCNRSNDWNSRRRGLGCLHRLIAAGGDNYGDRASNQFCNRYSL
jgi:hypothetical protein